MASKSLGSRIKKKVHSIQTYVLYACICSKKRKWWSPRSNRPDSLSSHIQIIPSASAYLSIEKSSCFHGLQCRFSPSVTTENAIATLRRRKKWGPHEVYCSIWRVCMTKFHLQKMQAWAGRALPEHISCMVDHQPRNVFTLHLYLIPSRLPLIFLLLDPSVRKTYSKYRNGIYRRWNVLRTFQLLLALDPNIQYNSSIFRGNWQLIEKG